MRLEESLRQLFKVMNVHANFVIVTGRMPGEAEQEQNFLNFVSPS